MKTTVSLYDFREAFRTMGRAEQYEEDTGEELELDVAALCCDFYEDTVEAIAANYSIDLTECEDEDEQVEVVREYLEDNGAFVGAVTGGFVYRAF